MAKSKICDFCLDEPKGLFNKPKLLKDGHSICKRCKKIIERYSLPVRYDIFQLLVTNEPSMRNMIIGNYLEQHTPEEIIAKFFPLPNMLLHDGERAINVVDSSITVLSSLVPQEKKNKRIADITRKDFDQLYSVEAENGTATIKGKLYETDAALYFISDNFINCHRLTNMIHNNSELKTIVVNEKGKTFKYNVAHADLFYMREALFLKAAAVQSNKSGNLIYLSSDNTMTITPGIYSIPKNILPGTYYVSPLKDHGMHVKDALGRVKECRSGRVQLDEGSSLEVTGEYQLRRKEKEL